MELQRVQQMEARLAAYTAELVTELARRRPDTLDRQVDEPGAASPHWAPGPGRGVVVGVSEFFADELAHVLNCSRAAATRLADSAALLTRLLPSTWEALADGQLDWPRARALAAELLDPAREVAAEVIAAVEAAVLPRAGRLSITGLRAAARRELLRHDAAAANRRRREAERAADVTLRPARDGLATLAPLGPAPLTTAIWQTIDSYARMAKADGDPRSLGQLRVGVLGDLVLRPWDTSRPPVTAHVTVVAPLAALESGVAGHDACAVGHPPSPDGTPDSCGRGEPADVNGEPITAAQLRKLLEQLDALCPGGMQAPAGGTLNVALVGPVNGALRAAVTRPELERLVRRRCADHPGDGCACPVLDRPAPDRYRPTPAHYRYVRTRDRTCRHPGCRNGAGWADLDHVVPHADGGPTDCANLCCLCRRHHRLKTHAPGWRFVMTSDGVLSVTTPSGVTRTSHPPGLREPTGGPVWLDDPPPL